MNMQTPLTPEQEKFAVNLIGQARTHEEWLPIVRFGLGTLLQSPQLLVRVIGDEAMKECSRQHWYLPDDGDKLTENMASILGELGLVISLEPEGPDDTYNLIQSAYSHLEMELSSSDDPDDIVNRLRNWLTKHKT